MPTPRPLLCAIALAVVSLTSQAASTVYASSAAFLAQVAPGAYTESFDALANPAPGAVPFAGGAYAYSAFAPGDIYLAGGFLGTSLPDEALTITFTSGNVSALGADFYVTDIADTLQAVSVTVTLSDGTVETFTPTSAADSYRGFVSDVAIASLTVSGPGVSLYAGLDNMTVGMATVVPEPASWLLMGVGVAGLLAARRRRA